MDPWNGVVGGGFSDPRPTGSQPGLGPGDLIFRRSALSFLAARSTPFLAAVIRPGRHLSLAVRAYLEWGQPLPRSFRSAPIPLFHRAHLDVARLLSPCFAARSSPGRYRPPAAGGF